MSITFFNFLKIIRLPSFSLPTFPYQIQLLLIFFRVHLISQGIVCDHQLRQNLRPGRVILQSLY